MTCAHCKAILLDAALGALPPAAETELRAHLETCSPCRTEFETQRLLVATLDRGIAATVSPEPTPAFAARVHARIAEAEHSRQRGWLGWRTLTAGWALAMVAVFALWMNVSDPMRPTGGYTGPLGIGLYLPEIGSLPAIPSVREFSEEPVVVANSSGVLVAPGQWSGILRLYKAVQSERVDAASLFAAPPAVGDVAVKPLEMPELKIAPLEVSKPEAESKPAEPPPVPKRPSETSG